MAQRPIARFLLAGLAAVGTPATSSAAPPGEGAEADQSGETLEAAPPIADWRFKDQDRKVKVVVLAGSVGAYPAKPYPEWFQSMCSEVEVKNLSMTGFGAFQLRKRFKEQVLDNENIHFRREGQELWLVFSGGLNSVATPERTNRDIRDIYVHAHKRGMKVVGLSLLPWGADTDKRWRGARGLDYLRNTRKIVDFVLGRLTPKEALGIHRQNRTDPDAPWGAEELPDVAIDLYDSPMRDKAAPMRDVATMRELLRADERWQKRTAELTEVERTAQLEADALIASTIPQWYMRADLQAFDHIHPNREGHRVMAEAACPKLPASWGCTCPTSP